MRHMRRILCLVVMALAIALTGAAPSAAVEGNDAPTTTEPPPAPNIIPEPGQGVAPQDPGDRGGALQTIVFLVIVGGTAVMAGAVWRSSRKARAERGF